MKIFRWEIWFYFFIRQNISAQDASQELEERTALEDVFRWRLEATQFILINSILLFSRFDSEMTEEEDNVKKIVDVRSDFKNIFKV